MSKIENIGEQLLPAIAYGDAAGLPVETMSRERIAETYGSIDHLLPATCNPFYIGEFTPGTWSDDTQLSMAVARALTRVHRFDMTTIAGEHVAEYMHTPQVIKKSGQAVKRGWGGSTTAAVERYIAGSPTYECGTPSGAGNGVIMKMAPLAWWLIAHETVDQEAYAQLDEFTSFTHASDVAKVASRVHYDVLTYLHDAIPLRDLGGAAYVSAWLHEGEVGEDNHSVSNSLYYLTGDRIRTTDDILSNTDGKGFYVPETLAMAYGAYILNGGEYTSSVYEAVNMGGDTDSTASIVAAMSLFQHGDVTHRPNDFEQTLHYDGLRDVSRGLVEAAA